MEASPLVSVIIPTYNSSSTIIQAIESVFKQSHKNFEVIVVDDGSTDNTENLLGPYVRDSKITYLYQSNQGCGAARTRGLRSLAENTLLFLTLTIIGMRKNWNDK